MCSTDTPKSTCMAPSKQQCRSNAWAASRQQSRAPAPKAASAELGGCAVPSAGATAPDAHSAARKSALHVFLLVRRSNDGRHMLPEAPPLSSSTTCKSAWWVINMRRRHTFHYFNLHALHNNTPKKYPPICFQVAAAIAQFCRQCMVAE